jgi:hypothetical protein
VPEASEALATLIKGLCVTCANQCIVAQAIDRGSPSNILCKLSAAVAHSAGEVGTPSVHRCSLIFPNTTTNLAITSTATNYDIFYAFITGNWSVRQSRRPYRYWTARTSRVLEAVLHGIRVLPCWRCRSQRGQGCSVLRRSGDCASTAGKLSRSHRSA